MMTDDAKAGPLTSPTFAAVCNIPNILPTTDASGAAALTSSKFALSIIVVRSFTSTLYHDNSRESHRSYSPNEQYR